MCDSLIRLKKKNDEDDEDDAGSHFALLTFDWRVNVLYGTTVRRHTGSRTHETKFQGNKLIGKSISSGGANRAAFLGFSFRKSLADMRLRGSFYFIVWWHAGIALESLFVP